MSKFYGTVVGSAETAATRRGFHRIKTAAQSWDGSVITELKYNENGELIVTVSVSSDSDTCGDRIFQGTFRQFIEKLSA